MKVHRTKPYVCVDTDFADHFRFQQTRDLETAAGTWLRCLAYSRAQEQDGIVRAVWARRTFAHSFDRIEELVAVGLLHVREDGDYEIHAYAPRNQTSAMVEEARKAARERMAAGRAKRLAAQAALSAPNDAPCSANEERTSTLVPTSLSISSSISTSISSLNKEKKGSQSHSGGGEGEERPPLPASERGMSGALWLRAFTDGVTEHTKRPCTAGRVFVATLERLVTHHAPERDAAKACMWLRSEARAFAAEWEGKNPAKGLTPDGLERWLNDGRQGPPEFGRPRIVQPAAEDWHEDDWSDLGAQVVR